MAFVYQQPNYYQNQGYIPQYNGYQQQPMLNGKVVESKDIVNATEIPFNSYGVFPQADFKKIYIKNWLPNGSTEIIEYDVVEKNNTNKKTSNLGDILDGIKKSISDLNIKIDKLSHEESEVDCDDL